MKGERRASLERRRFVYTCHIPERRNGEERRKQRDGGLGRIDRGAERREPVS